MKELKILKQFLPKSQSSYLVSVPEYIRCSETKTKSSKCMLLWPQMLSSTSGFVDRKTKFRTMQFIVLTLHLLKTTGDPLPSFKQMLFRPYLSLPFSLSAHPTVSASGSHLYPPGSPSVSSSTAPAGMHAVSALLQLWGCCLYPYLGQPPSALAMGIQDKLNSLVLLWREKIKKNGQLRHAYIFSRALTPTPS